MTAQKHDSAFPFTTDIAFQAGDIVFATDRLGRVVYWNKEAEVISGYGADEVLGKPYTFACRMDPEAAGVDLAAVIGGRDFAGGVRCRSRSGEDTALYLFATGGRNPAGEPVGVVFVGRDVTGLWRAEEAAQASADKYRQLFENLLDSVAIADLEGRVQEANPACLRLYGYTAEDVKRMNLTDVVAPEDRRAAAEAMASLAAGRPVARTMRMRRKDGTRFVVDLVASAMTVNGERRIMSVTRDVTERVNAERTKGQSERMYRAVFESANDAVFIESVDGRILDVNRNGCELLGYRRNELVKMSVSDLVPAEARAWLPHVTDAILRDKTFRTEAVRVHKNGSQIPVEMSASTMELDGKTVVLTIVRDITERKLAERALRESEEKFRSVSEQSPNMIFINSRGRVVYANQKSVDEMGYTREEFYAPGFDFMQLIAPESAEQVKAVYARHSRGEEVAPYEYTLVTKEGRRIAAIITTRLIDYQGAKAILGIVTDITERVRADRALREEKEKSQTYLALAGAILVALDSAGRITLLNRRGCQVLGVTEQDALGRNWFDTFVPEHCRASVKAGFALLMQGNPEPAEHYDNPVLAAGGEERLIAWHNVLLRDEQGRPNGTLSSGEDVTERERALASLRESEERYRRLLETSPDGIAVHQDGKVVLMNPAGARLLGYDEPADVAGTSVVDFLHPDDKDEVLERMRSVLASGPTPGPAQARFRRRDGSYVPLEVANATLTWQGRPAIQVVFRDVSVREAADQVLRESEEKYRSVVERASDGICVIQDGRLKYVNPKLAEMAGYAPEELVGSEFMRFLHPEDRASVADRYRRRLAGEQLPATYTIRFLRRAGDAVPVEVNAALATYDGAAAEIVLVRDVTERERMLAELNKARGRYESLLQSVRDGVVTFDMEGRITWVNDLVIRLAGLPLGFWQGRHFAELAPPDQRALFVSRFEAVMRGEQVAPYEFAVPLPDGRTVWVEANPAAIRADGAVVGSVLVLRDLTERKRAEQALRESEENFRALAENASDGLTIGDETGRQVFANRRAAEILGYPVEKLLRMTYRDYLPPGDREMLEERFARRLRGEDVPSHYDAAILRGDGRIVPIEVGVSETRWHGRRAIMVMFHDIAQRKRAEPTRAASEEKYRGLVESSPDGIAVYQNGVVVLANREAARLLDYGEGAELVGRTAASLVCPDDLPRVEERGELLRSGGTASGPLLVRFLSRRGGTVPAEVVAAVTTWRGEPAIQIVARPLSAPPKSGQPISG